MKQLVFICHKDHLVSHSIHFMIELFEKEFHVNIIPYDQGMNYIDTVVKTHSDAIYVLWQTEFLGPWLLSQGLKVVIFPMYDGCANAPKSYFRVLDNGYLFNFSKVLHQKSVKAGLVSYPLNYFPASDVSKEIEKKEKMFFWLRRPNSSLSEQNIIELFSPYIDGLHIHDRPDGYSIVSSVSITPDSYKSISHWFDDKNELIELIQRSKYYLAPRESEGIGMGFLEAMANGAIVFANNSSTHNQYIYDGYNGFLIDFDSGDKKRIRKQIKKAFEIIKSGKPIGENAQKFIIENRDIWEEQSNKLLEMLKILDHTPNSRAYSLLTQTIAYLLAKLYYKSSLLYLGSLKTIEPILAPKGKKVKKIDLFNGLTTLYKQFRKSSR
jgi:glycosyltransferase involved in cell wall biosynthesis